MGIIFVNALAFWLVVAAGKVIEVKDMDMEMDTIEEVEMMKMDSRNMDMTKMDARGMDMRKMEALDMMDMATVNKVMRRNVHPMYVADLQTTPSVGYVTGQEPLPTAAAAYVPSSGQRPPWFAPAASYYSYSSSSGGGYQTLPFWHLYQALSGEDRPHGATTPYIDDRLEGYQPATEAFYVATFPGTYVYQARPNATVRATPATGTEDSSRWTSQKTNGLPTLHIHRVEDTTNVGSFFVDDQQRIQQSAAWSSPTHLSYHGTSGGLPWYNSQTYLVVSTTPAYHTASYWPYHGPANYPQGIFSNYGVHLGVSIPIAARPEPSIIILGAYY